MKYLFKNFILLSNIVLCIGSFPVETSILSYELNVRTQANRSIKKQRTLEFAITGLVLVRVDSGESYSGKLIKYNSKYVTISLEGKSKKIPIASINEIIFNQKLVSGESEPKRSRMPIRGFKILHGLPITAFKLYDPPSKGSLDISAMSREGFDKFIKHENCPCEINTIIFNQNRITVKISELS